MLIFGLSLIAGGVNTKSRYSTGKTPDYNLL